MTPEERDQLQDDYVYEIAEGMDHKAAFDCLINFLVSVYNEYSDDELLTEIKDNYPHLLSNETDTTNAT